jgi:uncharacterized protein (DUF1015 family)
VTEIRPFSAYRYTRELGPRIAPPYDVLSDADRAAYAREPENVVHVTLPEGPEGQRSYGTAATLFRNWIGQGVLEQDPEPHLYVLYERTPGGETRRGFFGLVRLAGYDEGKVLPHERTMPGPKEDRLRLTREVRANLEPLFFLYEDREGSLEEVLERVTSTPSVARATGPDGTELALFAPPPAEPLRRLQSLLEERPLVIADGHHRYETMVHYRDECRAARPRDPDAPHEFVMGYLVNAFDPGTRVRAIHRVVQRPLETVRAAAGAAGFAVESMPEETDPSSALAELGRLNETEHAFVLVGKAGAPLLLRRPRGEDLDVEVLHAKLLPEEPGAARFDADAERVFGAARDGDGVGLLLNPVSADELFRVVREGRLLPQKSTYFSPKVPSGLVFRDLE